jgi:hydroxymethylbilane synthase
VREDIEIVPIRGNVETRLRRAFDKGDGSLDGVVLAMAGLERSGLLDAHRDTVYPFDLETCTPAGGQGALAVQARADDIQTRQTVVIVDNPQAHAALLAERYILRSLGAQCRSCLAVHVAPDAANDWVACAMFARPDGSELRRATAKSESAETAGKILLGRLLKMGAHEVICDAI